MYINLHIGTSVGGLYNQDGLKIKDCKIEVLL